MLSRVAESIYWIGRYLERTENVARIINVNSNLLLDLPKGVTPGWEPLIWILGCEKEYAEHHEEVTERRVVKFLISDTDYTGSIFSSLGYARENARTIREILPKSAWEELNALHQRTVDNVQQSQARKSRHDYLWNIISGLQQHTGLLAGTMNHIDTGKGQARAESAVARGVGVNLPAQLNSGDEQLPYFITAQIDLQGADPPSGIDPVTDPLGTRTQVSQPPCHHRPLISVLIIASHLNARPGAVIIDFLPETTKVER